MHKLVITDGAINLDLSGLKRYVNEKCTVFLLSVNEHGKSIKVLEEDFSSLADVSFSPFKTGHYYLKVILKDAFQSFDTLSIFFITDKDRANVKSEISNAKSDADELPYFSALSPQNDFLVTVSSDKEISSNVELLLKKHPFNSLHREELSFGNIKAEVFFREPFKKNNLDESFLFSGYCWLEDRFVYGQSQIKKPDVSLFHNTPLGMYTLLHSTTKKAVVKSDYYSFCKLFYFEGGGIKVVANNYHLLVLFLKNSGVKLEVDFSVIYSQFCSNVTLFLQSFNNKMPIKGTYMLDTWEEVCIDSSGLNIERKDIYHSFSAPHVSAPHDFEEGKARYDKLVSEAAKEIEKNISLVASSEFYKNISVDLSGGRDSRVNYAALTRLTNREKFTVKSNIHEPDDLQVAISVNNFYKVPYDCDGEEIEYPGMRGLVLKKRSFNMGYRYLWYIPQALNKKPDDKIRISGESFEAFSTRYYSNVLKDPLNVSDPKKLLEEYFSKLSKQPLLSFSEMYSNVYNSLLYSLDRAPDENPVIAFDNLFLYYRMATHAGNLDRDYYDGACCMPLQSKAILPAKLWWINNYYHDMIIFDVTFKLNPLLSVLPYNSSKTNKMREDAYRDLLVSQSEFDGLDICMDDNVDGWDSSFKKRKSSTNVTGNPVSPDDESAYIKSEILSFAKLLSDAFPEIEDTLLIPCVYQALDKASSQTQSRIIHNKLASLRDIAVIQKS